MKDSKYDPEDIDTKYLVPNEYLMDKLDLPDHVRQTLVDTYKQLTLVLIRPDMYDNPVEYVEGLEYTLQVLWKFIPDRNRHSYWNKLRGCTCPKIDNDVMIGNPYRVISGDCPFHANQEANRND